VDLLEWLPAGITLDIRAVYIALIVMGLFFLKKLIRLAAVLALIGAGVLFAESQGFDLSEHIGTALSGFQALDLRNLLGL